jgi:hypothetical protein
MECAKDLSVSLVSVSVEKIEGNLMSLMIVVGVLILVVSAFFSGRFSHARDDPVPQVQSVPAELPPVLLQVQTKPADPTTEKEKEFLSTPLEPSKTNDIGPQEHEMRDNSSLKERNFQSNPLEQSKIDDVPGVGPATRDKLLQKGINKAEQLVAHFLMNNSNVDEMSKWLMKECEVKQREAKKISEALYKKAGNFKCQ